MKGGNEKLNYSLGRRKVKKIDIEMKESYNLNRTANYSYIIFSLHNSVILASFYIVFVILVYQNTIW